MLSYSFHDTTLGIDCGVRAASDGLDRCIPVFAINLGFGFADSACSIPVAAFPSSTVGCPAAIPTHGAAYEADSCGHFYRVHQLGSEVATIYQNSGGPCIVGTKIAGWTYVQLGAEVSPSNFVAFTLQ